LGLDCRLAMTITIDVTDDLANIVSYD
jgi:hypothetical protein